MHPAFFLEACKCLRYILPIIAPYLSVTHFVTTALINAPVTQWKQRR